MNGPTVLGMPARTSGWPMRTLWMGDADVGVERGLQAEAGGEAVQRHDDRLLQRPHGLVERAQMQEMLLHGLLVEAGGVVQVLTGGERALAGSGQHDSADGFIARSGRSARAAAGPAFRC